MLGAAIQFARPHVDAAMRGPARLLAAVHRPSKCTVLLCVFAALACTAAGVEPSEGNPFPCEIQGKWTTLSSDYKGDPLGDGHVEVECDVAGKELHVSADGRVLQTGAQCPTNAETGQGDDPPYFARTEALFTSLTAHTPWDGGSGSGCFCFYAVRRAALERLHPRLLWPLTWASDVRCAAPKRRRHRGADH